jgi:hypothetical protein
MYLLVSKTRDRDICILLRRNEIISLMVVFLRTAKSQKGLRPHRKSR